MSGSGFGYELWLMVQGIFFSFFVCVSGGHKFYTQIENYFMNIRKQRASMVEKCDKQASNNPVDE